MMLLPLATLPEPPPVLDELLDVLELEVELLELEELELEEPVAPPEEELAVSSPPQANKADDSSISGT